MSDENKGFSFVKCCKYNKGYIQFDDVFYIDLKDDRPIILDHIEYCPWCGILLDTNLLDAHPEAKEEEWHGFGDDGKFGPLDD